MELIEVPNRPGFTGIWIPVEIWKREDLKHIDRVLWAEIHALYHGAVEQGKPGCYKRTETFAAEYGVTVKTMKTMMRRLKDSGLIEICAFDGRRRYLRSILPGGVEIAPAAGEKITPAEGEKITPQKENKKENSKKENMSGKPDVAAVSKKVIGRLNERMGTAYKPHTKATLRLISARLKEGFEEEDFLKAIGYCIYKWKDDPKMSPYIRPQTIFSTKMEAYAQGFNREKAEAKHGEVKRGEREQRALYGGPTRTDEKVG